MIAASFNESNLVLGKPAELNDDQCSCLSVLKTKTEGGTPVVISCWKLTREELDEITRTGRVWLTVMGESMPPVALDGLRPFEVEE